MDSQDREAIDQILPPRLMEDVLGSGVLAEIYKAQTGVDVIKVDSISSEAGSGNTPSQTRAQQIIDAINNLEKGLPSEVDTHQVDSLNKVSGNNEENTTALIDASRDYSANYLNWLANPDEASIGYMSGGLIIHELNNLIARLSLAYYNQSGEYNARIKALCGSTLSLMTTIQRAELSGGRLSPHTVTIQDVIDSLGYLSTELGEESIGEIIKTQDLQHSIQTIDEYLCVRTMLLNAITAQRNNQSGSRVIQLSVVEDKDSSTVTYQISDNATQDWSDEYTDAIRELYRLGVKNPNIPLMAVKGGGKLSGFVIGRMFGSRLGDQEEFESKFAPKFEDANPDETEASAGLKSVILRFPIFMGSDS